VIPAVVSDKMRLFGFVCQVEIHEKRGVRARCNPRYYARDLKWLIPAWVANIDLNQQRSFFIMRATNDDGVPDTYSLVLKNALPDPQGKRLGANLKAA
jgi:hypothetical protein